MSLIPKISFSLLALVEKYDSLEKAIINFNEMDIDMWHYDVSNEKKTLALDYLPKLKLYSKHPFDIHLSVADPIPYLSNLILDKNDFLCVHIENNLSILDIKTIRQQLKCKFGMAIKIETPIENLVPVMNDIDYVLFMAATPGVSGGSFNETVIEKIEEFKNIFPNFRVHVDGGINNISAKILRNLGVDVLISGSYLIKDEYSKQLEKLIGKNLTYCVGSIMYANDELPVISEDASLSEVAKEIDEKKIGCVCVKRADNKFAGLITDTDIRKHIIRNLDLTDLKASQIMNRTPFITNTDTTVINLIREIENKGSFFTVVPVVDKDGVCVGIIRLQDIMFNKLIKFRVRSL